MIIWHVLFLAGKKKRIWRFLKSNFFRGIVIKREGDKCKYTRITESFEKQSYSSGGDLYSYLG